jgi:AraC family transcriptional regulator
MLEGSADGVQEHSAAATGADDGITFSFTHFSTLSLEGDAAGGIPCPITGQDGDNLRQGPVPGKAGVDPVIDDFAHPYDHGAMILRYLAYGERWYGDRPLPPTPRVTWELEAVIAGTCGPWLAGPAGGDESPLRRRCLWVFPAGHTHGWRGTPGLTCRVAVIQFHEVPEALRRALAESAAPFLEVNLRPGDARRFLHIIRALEPDYLRPNALTPLRVERAALDITLLVLERLAAGASPTPASAGGAAPQAPPSTAGSEAARRVAQALSWYSENLDAGPGVAAMAQAIHVSPAHLRRLFAQARAGAPLDRMRQLQLSRARQWLRDTDVPLKQIAAACGFRSPVVFSRVFRQLVGQPPAAWRRTQHL